MNDPDYKSFFVRVSGQGTLPGLHEGVKNDAYRDGMDAGRMAVKAVSMGWAKVAKLTDKAAWMKVVDEYAGMQEFEKDPDWMKGFRAALIGHYGKDVRLEAAKPSAQEEYARLADAVSKRLQKIDAALKDHAAKQSKKPLSFGYAGDLKHVEESLAEIESFLRSAR